MTRLFTLALFAILAAGCARSEFVERCPSGFRYDRQDGELTCVCDDDSVCPEGHVCTDGECVCTDDLCCPEGYRVDPEVPGRCVCQSETCCEDGFDFVAPEGSRGDGGVADAGDADGGPAGPLPLGSCICASPDCCPEDHTFDPATQRCECAGDECCPFETVWNPVTEVCDCVSDACCPPDHRYDPVLQGCECIADSCCPDDHTYSPSVEACVCRGVGCCPVGFEKGGDGICRCTSDAACPSRLTCDPRSGRCVCSVDRDCGKGRFCNAFGFCQTVASCLSNYDCPRGTICNTETDVCVDGGQCYLDVHCAIGKLCVEGACVDGCNVASDCPLRRSCQPSAAKPPAPAGLCSDICEDNQWCPYLNFCVGGGCVAAQNQYCSTCDVCTFPNVCLLPISEGEGAFCGVPCASDDDCPSGMDCGNVVHSCPDSLVGRSCNEEGTTCIRYEKVVNEPDPINFCTKPGEPEPHVFDRFCSPVVGFCR